MIPNTDCLRNKLDIGDAGELRSTEAVYVAAREAQLLRISFRKTFRLPHLQFIHRWLFQDIYDWAGIFRSVPFSKGDSEFAKPLYLEPQANRVLGELVSDGLLRPEADSVDVPSRLTYYFGELNVLHPFREGNGRTQRLFLSHVAERRGLVLHWDDVSREEMTAVSIASHRGADGPALQMFSRILQIARPASS